MQHPPLPRLFIVGAPKAGTTTLAAWWHLHPEGFTAPGKEIRYFNAHHERGQDWYRQRYASMAEDQVGCDATPAYMYTPHALARMAEEVPDARLVAVLREPVRRVWSHWCYFTALGIEARPFAEVVEDAELGWARRGPDYAHFSRYRSALRLVTDHVDRDRLLVLFTDELRADRQGVFDRLSDHAGVGRAPLPDVPDRNVGALPRWPKAQHLLQRAKAGRWPGGVGQRLFELNGRLGGRPTMAPEHGERLRAVFATELDGLAAWLGRPLPTSWQVPAELAA